MSVAHGHELRATDLTGPVADALADAESGHISYLTRDGQAVAAVVSVGELTELQAAQDGWDIAEAEAIRARPGALIPHDVVEAMMDADDGAHDDMASALDTCAGVAVLPEAVRGMWEAVIAQRSV